MVFDFDDRTAMLEALGQPVVLPHYGLSIMAQLSTAYISEDMSGRSIEGSLTTLTVNPEDVETYEIAQGTEIMVDDVSYYVASSQKEKTGFYRLILTKEAPV